MFSRPLDSLQFQLLRWLLIPLLLLLLINAWFSNRAAEATANLAFDRLLTASAEAIAEDVEVKDGEIVVDLPYAALQLLESNIQERIFYRVIAPNGHTLTGYDDLPQPKALAVPPEESVFYSARYRDETIHLVALSKQLYGAAPALSPAAPVIIIVAETSEARYALSDQIFNDGLIRQALLIATAVMLVWFGLNRGLKPLGLLRASVSQREPSDLSPIDPLGVQREVRPLIDALNQHMTRISNLLASRQRLITDASHQMRTPLSEMRTQIEYTLRQQRPEMSHAALVDVHADIDRLARLISQMLLQARSDPDVLPDQRTTPVNLSELARVTALEYVTAARQKTIDLGFEDSDEPSIVQGNPMLLRELIANLVDNAIAYGHEGGQVVVRLVGGHETLLEVEDDGPGIAPSERAKVFDRFYRAPGSRVNGSGLGLSIARDICLAHRASIELATPSSGVGLVVRVHLQAAQAGHASVQQPAT